MPPLKLLASAYSCPPSPPPSAKLCTDCARNVTQFHRAAAGIVEVCGSASVCGPSSLSGSSAAVFVSSAAAPPDDWGTSPLFYSVQYRHAECLNLLLHRPEWARGQVEHGDSDGSTPLMVAARRGTVACVSTLLQHGAALETRDSRGLNAVHHAATRGKAEVLEVLLHHALSALARLLDNLGNSALAENVVCREQLQQEALLQAGQSSLPDVAQAIAFHAEFPLADDAALELLRSGAASPTLSLARASRTNMCGVQDGHSVFASKSSSSSSSSSSTLKRQQAVFHTLYLADARCAQGKTPLMYAASFGREHACQVLLQRHASVELVDKDGNTAAHYAARAGKLGCVVLLAQFGGSVHAPNLQGETPLQLLESHGISVYMPPVSSPHLNKNAAAAAAAADTPDSPAVAPFQTGAPHQQPAAVLVPELRRRISSLRRLCWSSIVSHHLPVSLDVTRTIVVGILEQ